MAACLWELDARAPGEAAAGGAVLEANPSRVCPQLKGMVATLPICGGVIWVACAQGLAPKSALSVLVLAGKELGGDDQRRQERCQYPVCQ